MCDVRFLSRIQGSQNSIFKNNNHNNITSTSPPCLSIPTRLLRVHTMSHQEWWPQLCSKPCCPQSPCIEVFGVCLSQGLCSHKWGRRPYKRWERGHPGFLLPFCQVRTQQLAASCRQMLLPETGRCLGLCSLCSCVVTHLPTPREERRGDGMRREGGKDIGWGRMDTIKAQYILVYKCGCENHWKFISNML